MIEAGLFLGTIWVAAMLIWWKAMRYRKLRDDRPTVCCSQCARRGNGCPIAPRDYAAKIFCVEYRAMQPALRTPTTNTRKTAC